MRFFAWECRRKTFWLLVGNLVEAQLHNSWHFTGKGWLRCHRPLFLAFCSSRNSLHFLRSHFLKNYATLPDSWSLRRDLTESDCMWSAFCCLLGDTWSTIQQVQLRIANHPKTVLCFVPQIRTLILLLLWKYLLHLCWYFDFLENPTFVGLNKMPSKTLSRELLILFCPPRCAAWSTEILRCCFPVIDRHILRNVPGIAFFFRGWPRGGTSGWNYHLNHGRKQSHASRKSCLKSCSCNISLMNQPQNPWFRRKKWMFSKWPSLPFRSTVFSHVEVKRTIKSPCSLLQGAVVAVRWHIFLFWSTYTVTSQQFQVDISIPQEILVASMRNSNFWKPAVASF